MANPFKDGEKKKKVSPGGVKPEPYVEPVVEETPTPASEPVVESTEAAPVGKDFLAKFVEPKSEGKSYSVYLSAEAGKKLEKLAKQLKCSKSKALDILLRNAVE
jgi:hypothetical protein